MKNVSVGRGRRASRMALTALLCASFGAVSLSPAVACALDGTAATSEVAAASSEQASYDDGMLGFARYLGDSAMERVIVNAPSTGVIGPYNDLSTMGEKSNAFNLDNMEKSLDFLAECNRLRKQEGLSELLVDPYLMAVSAAQLNYSKSAGGHSQAFSVPENVAWGYANPFTGWYNEEKAYWESDACSAARAYFDSVSGSFNTKLNALHKNYSDVYSKVGHYLNIINTDYEYMGASYVAQGSIIGNAAGQVFYFSAKSSKTYTVAEFTKLFNEYRATLDDQEPDTPTEPEKPQQYAISITADSYGKASLSATQAAAGQTVTITAEPITGYNVDEVTVTDVSGKAVQVTKTSGTTWTFTMPASAASVKVTFERTTYKLNVVAGEHGTVTSSHTQAQMDNPITITIKPDEGYAVDKISVTNANGKDMSYTFDDKAGTVTFPMDPSNVTVKVTFAKDAYPVSTEDGKYGTVKVNKLSAQKGDTVTVTTTPTTGYVTKSVKVVDEEGTTVAVTKVNDTTWTFVMPASPVKVTAEFELADENDWSCDGGASCPSHGFSDVKVELWYHQAIDWAAENGVMNGYEGTDRFGPEDELTRGQAACVLYNYLGDGEKAPSAGFADVPAGKFYTDAVNWAAKYDIMNGYDGSNNFGPNDTLTREQLACIIANAAGETGGSVSALEGLLGVDDVSSWALSSVTWAVEHGVVNGVDIGGGKRDLRPQDAVTRAQMAAIMFNATSHDILTK